MADDRLQIEAGLVRALIAAQFPQWAGLPVSAVAANGWDNTSFRLGPEMKVRLPTAARYVPQVTKEYAWLPRLAPHLPLPIPEPLALGTPALGYPFPWAIYRWLEGESARPELIADQRRFAADLAAFLLALQRVPAAGGPPAGPDNFHRGGSLTVYDAETRRNLAELARELPAAEATAVWEAAQAAPWSGPAVWVHGDVAPGNLLLRDGRLAAVIDFGSCAVGDPACDLTVAWTLLAPEGRNEFRERMAADESTWARARGWALWKCLITIAAGTSASPWWLLKEITSTGGPP